jgi:8-oxo-dGTP diphosphatase
MTQIRTLEGRVRLRVCGLVLHEGALLMVHLNAPTRPQPFWSVPGGGLQFGERVFDAVEREINEETGLTVQAENLLVVNEFIEPPWHAVEFYVKCTLQGGTLITGNDPELPPEKQMILENAWVKLEDLKSRTVNPPWLTDFLLSGKKAEREGLFFV